MLNRSPQTENISGWGRWPKADCLVLNPTNIDDLVKSVPVECVARGLGRSYGDSALNPKATVVTTGLDRIISFDKETGVLQAEAGISLAKIIKVFLPKGYFPAVTPGTKFITLGGAISADVHGKNHHIDGSFGDYVLWMDLLTHDGRIVRCSPDCNKDLFNAVTGGMGLTGFILSAAIQLRPVKSGWISQETHVAEDLEKTIEIFESNIEATYSVAWIDCLSRGRSLGRSLVYLGEHADPDDLSSRQREDIFGMAESRRLKIPFDFPEWALNGLTVKAFNALYYLKGKAARQLSCVHWDKYFYPLDGIEGWNKIYGARGFSQYQCVIPLASSHEALTHMLGLIGEARQGSFLAVLKRFGKGAEERPLSFPIEGYTLALDFAVNDASLKLMDQLDEIVLKYDGKLYLAKDSRMSPKTFENSYSRSDFKDSAFSRSRELKIKYWSLQSKRLGL